MRSLLVLMLTILGGCLCGGESAAPKPPSAWFTKAGSFLIAREEADLHRVIKLAVSHDLGAVERMIQAGRASPLSGDREVDIVSTSGFTSLLQVRFVGTVDQGWVVRESVEERVVRPRPAATRD